MAEIPEYVRELLHSIAKTEGFYNDHTLNVKPGCNQGDGFLSVVTSVTISGQRVKNNIRTNDQLYLVCKSAPENETMREGFDSIVQFKREACMYGKILPILADFEREKGLTESERFTSYPKCYAIVADDQNDQMVIVMEDVRTKGYAMWKRSEPIPPKYAYDLLEEIAKLHACSFALKDQRPNVYNSFRELIDVVLDFTSTKTMREIIRASYERCLAAVEDPKHIEIVNDIIKNSEKYYEDCVALENVEPFAVVSHGDFWINNILFRNNQEVSNSNVHNLALVFIIFFVFQAHIDLCILDWQMSRFGSLMMDLHYIMFTSIDKDVLFKDYHQIMRHYYDSLKDAAQRLGSNLGSYTYEVFREQLKKCSKVAAVMGLVMAQVFVVDVEDLKDISEKPKGDSADFVQKIEGTTELKYKNKVRNLLDVLIALEFY